MVLSLITKCNCDSITFVFLVINIMFMPITIISSCFIKSTILTTFIDSSTLLWHNFKLFHNINSYNFSNYSILLINKNFLIIKMSEDYINNFFKYITHTFDAYFNVTMKNLIYGFNDGITD